MNEGDVIGVLCPCCEKVLYRMVRVEAHINALETGSPTIEQDANGHYMKCRHCSRRVSMIRVGAHGSGAGFDIDPKQECGSPLA